MTNFVKTVESPNGQYRAKRETFVFLEGVTTIPKGSRAKRPEAQSPCMQGEEIVCSAWEHAAAPGHYDFWAELELASQLEHMDTQISFKTVAVSRTANTVKKYGRAKELARLVTKYGRELKRDIENALVGNQGSSAGSNTVARSSAGFEAMIFTTAGGGNGINAHNTTGTTSAYAGGVFLAPTDGSATVTVTEAILTSGIQAAWTDGGNPSVIMLPYNQKARMAAFSGATKYAGSYMNQSAQKQAALVGAVDLYISDAGEHKLVLNRYVRTRSILGIDPEYVSVAFLDGIQMHDLAKTGDSEKKLLVTEFCLQLDSLDAHFQIKDLLV